MSIDVASRSRVTETGQNADAEGASESTAPRTLIDEQTAVPATLLLD